MNSMGMYRILTLQQKDEWNLLISKLPINQQEIYYMPDYYSLYENNGDGEAKCFVYEENNDLALYPFLINSVNELGYKLDKGYFDIQGAYGYNGIISSSYSTDFIDGFYYAFNNFCCTYNIIAEFTRFHPLLDNKRFSLDNMGVIDDRKTVFVDLSNDYDIIRSNYQRSTKKQIRRSLNNSNVEVLSCKGADYCYKTFYKIYCENMNAINSTEYLLFSLDYFRELLLMKDVYVLYVLVDGIIISNISVFLSSIYINGHLGGSISNVSSYSPFSLLYDYMIKFGIINNKKLLHVGGGLSNSNDDKLLTFKQNFSKATSQFSIGKKVHNKSIYDNILLQYDLKHPQKSALNNNILLKYRNI